MKGSGNIRKGGKEEGLAPWSRWGEGVDVQRGELSPSFKGDGKPC